MKKIVKFFLLFLLAIVVLVALGAGYINFRGILTYDVKKIDYSVEVTPERVQRGKRWALMLCVFCHMGSDGKLTGKKMMDIPLEFGEIYSQNITRDEEFGIGKWTDGEILYVLRTGILPDGRYIPPYMPKLAHMSDEDIASIIAFLKSDDPLVAPAAVPDIPAKPSFLVKFLSYVAFKPLPFPEEPVPGSDTANVVEWGKYLAHNLDCYQCHSADFKTNNALEPEKSKGYFGGGNPVLDMEGKPVPSANLTPDKETGIGNWTEEQFVNAVKYGRVEGQPPLRYPMTPYVQLTDNEIKAIFAYLKTIPPIKNKIERQF